MITTFATRALRLLAAETAHKTTLCLTGLATPFLPQAGISDPRLMVKALGLSFPNPIGLAAGFDKNADVPDAMAKFGFGFVECGTVTPRPQAGNPRPRLFRLSEDRAVINRMGFNNRGLDAFAGRLARRRRSLGVIGANIGANKDSPDRVVDYVTGLKRLWGKASYFTINVSSPNTPGLRALQTESALHDLLGRLAEARETLPAQGRAPIFLKVAPDLQRNEIETIVETCVTYGLAGIMVSNTTVSRAMLA